MNDLVKTSTKMAHHVSYYNQQRRTLRLKMLTWASLSAVCTVVMLAFFTRFIVHGLSAPQLDWFVAFPTALAIVGGFVSHSKFKACQIDMHWIERDYQITSERYQNHIKQLEPGMLSVSNIEQQQGELSVSPKGDLEIYKEASQR